MCMVFRFTSASLLSATLPFRRGIAAPAPDGQLVLPRLDLDGAPRTVARAIRGGVADKGAAVQLLHEARVVVAQGRDVLRKVSGAAGLGSQPLEKFAI